MPTEAQIAANRENAKHSTGPATESGLERSSQNSTKHGFTGLTRIVIKPEEKEAYEAHVASYLKDYDPTSHRQKQLVQQLADLDWSLHQISVEQSNTLTHMNAVSSLPPDPYNPGAIIATLAPLSRILSNLNLYEVRRRRAAKAVEAELLALQKAEAEKYSSDLDQAAVIYKSYKAHGKPFDPAEFGFVCSLEDVEAFIEARQMASTVKPLANSASDPAAAASYQRMKTQMDADLREISRQIEVLEGGGKRP
jgi:hypothetical protein